MFIRVVAPFSNVCIDTHLYFFIQHLTFVTILKVPVETRMIEPKFFLSRLNRFLINGLIFLIPACKVLNNVLT